MYPQPGVKLEGGKRQTFKVLIKLTPRARFMGLTWGPPGPTWHRWAPCWPYDLCYLGIVVNCPLYPFSIISWPQIKSFLTKYLPGNKCVYHVKVNWVIHFADDSRVSQNADIYGPPEGWNWTIVKFPPNLKLTQWVYTPNLKGSSWCAF